MGVTHRDHRDAEVKQRPGELKEVGDNLGGHGGVTVDHGVVGGRLAQSFNIAKSTIIIGDSLRIAILLFILEQVIDQVPEVY